MDEDSGSVYESSSEDNKSSIHIKDIHESRAADIKASDRGRSLNRRITASSEDSFRDSSHEPSSSLDNQLVEDAQRWAATFEPPESPGDIRSPKRHLGKSRLKRRAKPPEVVRAKRLRSFYNFDYRQLLNVDIQQAASKMYQEDYYSLQQSQIGSSIWTAEEKHIFFTALATAGRNNIQDIATRIQSKSELEVQHYLQLLSQARTEKNDKKSHEMGVLSPSKLPAALEISGECSDLLERAGDSIAARQECSEAKVEQEKWGDIWLITPTVSRLLDRRRRADNGLEEMDEVLPAANLFVLKNWITLSERLFMNSSKPREEDNWNSLAELGEVPAVRATAFEDFHSLAVSVTKRLISTTLYCTMSRLRARDSHKTKHAEVNANDVEAAVNILGLKADTRDFWIGCARRCNLQVVNDDSTENVELEENVERTSSNMTYDEVEAALAHTPHQRSRSRSLSRRSASIPLEAAGPSSTAMPSKISGNTNSSNELVNDSDSILDLSDKSETDFVPINRDERIQLAKIEARREAEYAQDIYMEDVDRQASQIEEAKLWEMLKETMPLEMDMGAEKEKDSPKAVRDTVEGEDWRDYTEHWSHWETLETPVPERAFEVNRKRRSKIGKLRQAFAATGRLLGPEAYAAVEREGLESASEIDTTTNDGLEDSGLESGDELEESVIQDTPEHGKIDGSGSLSPSSFSVLSEDDI